MTQNTSQEKQLEYLPKKPSWHLTLPIPFYFSFVALVITSSHYIITVAVGVLFIGYYIYLHQTTFLSINDEINDVKNFKDWLYLIGIIFTIGMLILTAMIVF